MGFLNHQHYEPRSPWSLDNRILKGGGGGVIPLIFPKVPQSSQTESLGFPQQHPLPLRTLQTTNSVATPSFITSLFGDIFFKIHIPQFHRRDVCVCVCVCVDFFGNSQIYKAGPY